MKFCTRFFNLYGYDHPKFHAKMLKNEKVIKETQKGRFFYTPFNFCESENDQYLAPIAISHIIHDTDDLAYCKVDNVMIILLSLIYGD